jgi:UDP-glucose 4-epimerase
MRVVITGPTGAIGIALIELLLASEHEICVISNPNSIRNECLKKFRGIDIVECDLNDLSELQLNGKYDVFFNLAWSGGSCRNNVMQNYSSVTSSLAAIDLANKIGCSVFIGAGSQAECGRHEVPISSQTICKPESAFGAAKLAAYYLSMLRAKQLNLRFCWARILSVYGPFDGEGTLVISTLRKLINSQQLEFTSGTQTWDFLYSTDAAEALLQIAFSKNAEGIYVLGSGVPNELRGFITLITDKFAVNPMPYFGLIPSTVEQVNYLVADTSRLKSEFDWRPKTEFSKGIDKTFEYCVNAGQLK